MNEIDARQAEQMPLDEARREGEDRYRVLEAAVMHASDSVLITSAEIDSPGPEIIFVNPAFTRMTGYTQEEIKGHTPRILQGAKTDRAVLDKVREKISQGQSISAEAINYRKDGAEYAISWRIDPVRNQEGRVTHFVSVQRDITEQRRAEAALLEQTRLASLGADVGKALTQSNSLEEILQRCAEALVLHLDAAFARIWTLNSAENMLELRASAGLYTHTNGGHSRVPLGELKIGRIAAERRPHLTNDVANDARVTDTEWATREGIIAFAGYPLIVEDRVVGVMAKFARQPLTETCLQALASVADGIALGIERKRAEEQLQEAQEELERRVEQRTYELITANRLLKDEIAERKRAEQALTASEQIFRELVDMLPIAVYVCDLSGAIESYNKRAVELWGRAPQIKDIADGFCGSYKIYNLDGAYLPHAECPMAQVLRTGKSVSNEEIVIERPDGSRRTVMVNILPRRDELGNQTGAINCLADVTERKRADRERTQLLQRLVTAQEDERHRIARELHDQTGQYLAALMMGLKSLDDGAPSASRNSSDNGGGVKRLQELTGQFSKEMRNFALELRPTSLDDLGLQTALANYADEWSERYGIAVDFHSNGFIKQRLPPHIETALYRIVQEALTNVLKHAEAKRVSLIMEYRGNRVLGVLEDDGRGFNVEAALGAPVAERRLGLTGMRERIELVGGTLEIESSAGAGTTLVVRIPVEPYEGTIIQ
ncbi:MAG: PAS domain S-box protein [Pyrinomonadaceae bacterium]